MIEEVDIRAFIDSWRNGVISIAKIYDQNGDHRSEAIAFLKKHYLFDDEKVLFKPTMTQDIVFRNTLDEALSYFIGTSIKEDKGFALQKWKSIELIEVNMLIENDIAIAMGVFNFKNDNDLRVVFTFVLKDTIEGLKVKAHHSSRLN